MYMHVLYAYANRECI